MINWPKAVAIIALVVLVQVELADQRWVFGLGRVDLPLILVVGIAAVASPQQSAKLGFVVGLVVDIFQFSPFGLNALILCLVGWSLAVAKIRFLEPGAFFHSVQSSIAVILGTVAIWSTGAIFGLVPPEYGPSVFFNLALVGLSGALLVHPATRLAGLVVDSRMSQDRVGADVNG